MKAVLLRENGSHPVGLAGTVVPNTQRLIAVDYDGVGRFTPDYWFTPDRCGYSFAVRSSEVKLENR